MAGRQYDVSDEQILIEFLLSDDPALVAKELAGPLGMSRQGIHNRLDKLQDREMLHSKKPGRDRIYWLTTDGRQFATEALRNQED